jgi:FPC/CPF motif-containing protein YcgG
MLARIFSASLLFVTCFICSAAQQQSANVQQTLTSEKRALIKELLDTTDARKTAISMYKSMLEQEENQLPDLIWQGISGIKEVRELTSDQQQELRKQLIKESARTSQRIRTVFAENRPRPGRRRRFVRCL